MNLGSLAVARSRGIPLKAFAAEAIAVPGLMTDVIMVRKDSPIHTGADFNHKTVGIVAEKTMQHAAFLLWIDKHGGDSKTVGFVEIPFPEMVTALDQRRVDAIIPVEPFTSMGRANNRIIDSVYASMPPRFLIFGLVATERWLGANADAARKLAGTVRRAAVWANGHTKESSEMLVQLLKLNPAVASSMARAVYGTSLDPALISPVIDVMQKYGILTAPVTVNEMVWRPSAA
jgi:NitT/TauT family transport system substrate-binding protein